MKSSPTVAYVARFFKRDSITAAIILEVELNLRQFSYLRWRESRPHVNTLASRHARIQVWFAGDRRRRFEERGR